MTLAERNDQRKEPLQHYDLSPVVWPLTFDLRWTDPGGVHRGRQKPRWHHGHAEEDDGPDAGVSHHRGGEGELKPRPPRESPDWFWRQLMDCDWLLKHLNSYSDPHKTSDTNSFTFNPGRDFTFQRRWISSKLFW